MLRATSPLRRRRWMSSLVFVDHNLLHLKRSTGHAIQKSVPTAHPLRWSGAGHARHRARRLPRTRGIWRASRQGDRQAHRQVLRTLRRNRETHHTFDRLEPPDDTRKRLAKQKAWQGLLKITGVRRQCTLSPASLSWADPVLSARVSAAAIGGRSCLRA